MYKPKFLWKFVIFAFVLSVGNTFAQTAAKNDKIDNCYEIVLQTIIASNNKNEAQTVPNNLSNVVKKLKNLYNYTNYTVAETYLQRTSSSVDYKSVESNVNTEQSRNIPVFTEWGLRNLQELGILQGKKTIQFDTFRFGARVPVVLQNVKTEADKIAFPVSYEQIGITTSKFYLAENEPTVLGSLGTSKPNELMFLVLTVKPVE